MISKDKPYSYKEILRFQMKQYCFYFEERNDFKKETAMNFSAKITFPNEIICFWMKSYTRLSCHSCVKQVAFATAVWNGGISHGCVERGVVWVAKRSPFHTAVWNDPVSHGRGKWDPFYTLSDWPRPCETGPICHGRVKRRHFTQLCEKGNRLGGKTAPISHSRVKWLRFTRPWQRPVLHSRGNWDKYFSHPQTYNFIRKCYHCTKIHCCSI